MRGIRFTRSGRRWLGASLFVLTISGTPTSSVAEQQGLHAIAGGEDGRSIAFTACSEDEDWQECVSHDLSCGENAYDLSMTILGSEEGGGTNARAIARKLIDMPWGKAAARFLLAGGKARVDLPISAIGLSLNDMNGDWDLKLTFGDREPLFAALDKASAANVRVDVGGQTFELTPGTADGAKLLMLKKACEAVK